MNLYFVRHGETTENKTKVYYGNTDVELTQKGIFQAEKDAVKLRDVSFNKIFISHLKRTEQTARILLEGRSCKLIKDKRINEINFGDFEGKNYNEIKELYPKQWEDWCNDWKNNNPPKGESYVQFYDRVKSFMDDILKLREENILIIAHSGVIRSVYCYVLENNMDFFWKFKPRNGDISIVKYEYGNLYIDSITHI